MAKFDPPNSRTMAKLIPITLPSLLKVPAYSSPLLATVKHNRALPRNGRPILRLIELGRLLNEECSSRESRCSMAASAAYWIGTATDELVVTPSGQVGSIGVFAPHEDISKALEQEGVKVSLISAGKYKTEANPYEPLSAEARGSIQEMVNNFADMFVSVVARHRGVGGK